MKKSTLTWIGLLILTAVSALLSLLDGTYVIWGILCLAALKFIGVAFNFMELRKAHVFWKTATFLFLILFVAIVLYLIQNK